MKSYSLAQSGVLVRDLRGEVRERAFAGLVSAGHRVVQVIVSEIIPSFGDRMPVDRGVYRAGWRVQPLKGEGKVLVHNVAPHAAFIEHGVPAGHVRIGRKMIEALAEWVRRKGIGGRTVVSKSGRERRVKASAAEATAIAWAIAKSMQKKGIFAGGKGLGVLRKVEPRIPGIVKEEVERELRKVK